MPDTLDQRNEAGKLDKAEGIVGVVLAGYYERGLQTKAGEMRLRVPKLRRQTRERRR